LSKTTLDSAPASVLACHTVDGERHVHGCGIAP
jgi:hypothetical protein